MLLNSRLLGICRLQGFQYLGNWFGRYVRRHYAPGPRRYSTCPAGMKVTICGAGGRTGTFLFNILFYIYWRCSRPHFALQSVLISCVIGFNMNEWQADTVADCTYIQRLIVTQQVVVSLQLALTMGSSNMLNREPKPLCRISTTVVTILFSIAVIVCKWGYFEN